MSMWRKMREDYNVSIKEVASDNKKTKQFISQCELGKKKMPIELQIYYLRNFKRNELDETIADYLMSIL